MTRTAYDIAADYCRLGVKEKAGISGHPAIMHMLKLDQSWPQHDEVPWCAAFVNLIAFTAGLERSKKLLARSFLVVGLEIELDHARVGNDIIILMRGRGDQPGPGNLTAPGHVGLFAAATPSTIFILGGNQNDEVNIREYPASLLLGVRRLRPV